MKAPRTKIASVIANKSRDGFSKSEATEVAAYLLEERRVSELESILRDVSNLWAEQGYVEVKASSAYELSDQVKRDIEDQVRKVMPDAKQIRLNEIRDPELIGGVKLEFVNRQLDLSIQGELNKFKDLAVNGKD
jgi:F0F1-type ATP synthase delta subunit